MKTLFLSLTLILTINAFSQKPTIELSFSAENSYGQSIPLDSIIIMNLTQNVDTSLYAPDTVLTLDYITGIGDRGSRSGKNFELMQNSPNPFDEKTEINLILAEKEDIHIMIHDILGRTLAQYYYTFDPGKHFFTFYPGNEKYYLFTAIGRNTSKTLKMLNAYTDTRDGRKCKLVVNAKEDHSIRFKNRDAINTFVFNPGDQLKYKAYTSIGLKTKIDWPTSNQSYIFEFETGNPCPGTPTVTDVEGNVYHTVKIGTQCWMAENLKTTSYNNDTPIPNVTENNAWSNLMTGAYIWFDNDSTWKDLYGALYNWYAVNDTNGLCPTGWHVPTKDQWSNLISYIGGSASPNGNKLKSCRQVNSPLGWDCNTTIHPRWNFHNIHYGTNNYWFSGLPASYRTTNGTFTAIGFKTDWWTSTSENTNKAWSRWMFSSEGYINEGYFSKKNGFSVRCLLDL